MAETLEHLIPFIVVGGGLIGAIAWAIIGASREGTK